ncbi:putative zinc finger protein [Melghirimyces profundicolus]|uniref:Anti-sigma-W factor RsiW n=1 Tax=Melghirimyces profundicolus TaxID=1242148 RepID=A0A2T6C4Q9_9BACL|nr:zf-HC2 domain-containing protein [Melghirimyces profundicolus]PTX63319.1 putative zinc finger protein [Melghirimyces profundicolus]
MEKRSGDNIHSLAEFYVMDALDPEDQERYEEHLEGCSWCQRKVGDARRITEALLHLPKEEPPPPEVKKKLLSGLPAPFHRDRRRGAGLFPYVAVLLALILAGTSFLIWLYSAGKTTQASSTVVYKESVPRLGTPDESMLLEGKNDARATVHFFRGKEWKTVLSAVHLKRLSTGREYRLWSYEGNQPEYIGSFTVSRKGDGVMLVDGKPEGNPDRAVITEEARSRDFSQPGSKVVLSSEPSEKTKGKDRGKKEKSTSSPKHAEDAQSGKGDRQMAANPDPAPRIPDGRTFPRGEDRVPDDGRESKPSPDDPPAPPEEEDPTDEPEDPGSPPPDEEEALFSMEVGEHRIGVLDGEDPVTVEKKSAQPDSDEDSPADSEKLPLPSQEEGGEAGSVE